MDLEDQVLASSFTSEGKENHGSLPLHLLRVMGTIVVWIAVLELLTFLLAFGFLFAGYLTPAAQSFGWFLFGTPVAIIALFVLFAASILKTVTLVGGIHMKNCDNLRAAEVGMLLCLIPPFSGAYPVAILFFFMVRRADIRACFPK